MKAAKYYGPNDIRIEDVDEPKLTDDGIIIQMKAAGICGTDIHRWNTKGLKELTTDVVRIMGREFSGQVIEVGQNVSDIKQGDRVVAIGAGAFADYISIPKATLNWNVFILPDELSYELGATVQ